MRLEAESRAHAHQAAQAQLTAKIAELERQLKTAQGEVARIKHEHDRLADSLKRSLGAMVDARVAEHVKKLSSSLQV